MSTSPPCLRDGDDERPSPDSILLRRQKESSRKWTQKLLHFDRRQTGAFTPNAVAQISARWGIFNAQHSTTPVMPAKIFPIGYFTYTVGDASPVVHFDEHGKATATLDGQIIVVAAYKVIGDVIEIVDVEGPYAYPEGGLGKYKWSLNGKVLSFSLIEDGNPPRRKGFAEPFTKTE